MRLAAADMTVKAADGAGGGTGTGGGTGGGAGGLGGAVLILGLGGGTLAAFLQRHALGCRVDVVEGSAAVVHAAQEHFSFKCTLANREVIRDRCCCSHWPKGQGCKKRGRFQAAARRGVGRRVGRGEHRGPPGREHGGLLARRRRRLRREGRRRQREHLGRGRRGVCMARRGGGFPHDGGICCCNRESPLRRHRARSHGDGGRRAQRAARQSAGGAGRCGRRYYRGARRRPDVLGPL
ncbi:hypothetical protein T492DRAFT_290892 [Pavlovales sp. CCMP2436]|nr:hypothetical protein T492DRAFT_290892 [Pavlovales sp. CCMP2436]